MEKNISDKLNDLEKTLDVISSELCTALELQVKLTRELADRRCTASVYITRLYEAADQIPLSRLIDFTEGLEDFSAGLLQLDREDFSRVSGQVEMIRRKSLGYIRAANLVLGELIPAHIDLVCGYMEGQVPRDLTVGFIIKIENIVKNIQSST